MIEQFKAERPRFLHEALADAKKWCPAPDAPPVEGKKVSDQFWIRLFSYDSISVTADEAFKFFRDFGILAQRLEWDWNAVASQINQYQDKDPGDVREDIEKLAVNLSRCIRSEKQPLQISAASKIAFFTHPCLEVYIWDTNVRASVRLRRGRSRNARGYVSYANSCTKALDEERRCEDFIAALKSFSEYLLDVGGPMADKRILNKSSFVARRLLDKLMFREGVWIKDWKKAARATEGRVKAKSECLPKGSEAYKVPPVEQFVDESDEAFRQAAAYVLKKNAELYRRLA